MNTVSKSIDTWDDEAYSAAASAAVSTEDDEDRFGSVDDYENNPIDTLFSKVRHNRTDYVLGELRSGFNQMPKTAMGTPFFTSVRRIIIENSLQRFYSSAPPGRYGSTPKIKSFALHSTFAKSTVSPLWLNGSSRKVVLEATLAQLLHTCVEQNCPNARSRISRHKSTPPALFIGHPMEVYQAATQFKLEFQIEIGAVLLLHRSV